ncbi:MAG: hypothetical protein ACJ72D_24405 [Marmoricola sp.]
MPTPEPGRGVGWPARAATALVTAVVLGPLLVGGGVALRGDMVFVPDQPWKPAWLGLDGSVPRAVPMDALLSLIDDVVPGSVLQRVLLAAALLAGGLGIARLAAALVPTAQVAAVVVYLWNPWVHERLEIGQWATVLGYGLLPWMVVAAARVREREPGGWPRLALLLVAAGVCAPSVGLTGLVVAVVVVATGRDLRRVLGVLGTGALANLPWIVPALLGPTLRGNDVGFAAFAARGESSLGTLASLLSMGGIWKTSIVAPERTHAVVIAAAGLLSLGFAAGFRLAVPALGRRTAGAVAGLGLAALLAALLPSLGPVQDGLDALSSEVPALAMLRDSQRYLAPLGLVLALGAAALVHRLLTLAPATAADTSGRTAGAWAVVAAPLVLLPSMVWGLHGDLRPVHYPAEWSEVAAQVRGHDGAVVVLPWTGSYRGFAWNDDRAVLDPAPRFLPGEVLIDDRVLLGRTVVPSEDPFLARVGAALDRADPAPRLRALGVRWVLVEKGNGAPDLAGGTVVHDGRWLRLIDLGRRQNFAQNLRHEPPVWPVSLSNAITASVVFVSIWSLTRYLRRNRPKPM